MKLLAIATAAALTVSASAASADPGSDKATRPNDAVPQAQKAGSKDDMGDENASPKAIDTVCTKDTPAAERSAICDDGPPITRG